MVFAVCSQQLTSSNSVTDKYQCFISLFNPRLCYFLWGPGLAVQQTGQCFHILKFNMLRKPVGFIKAMLVFSYKTFVTGPNSVTPRAPCCTAGRASYPALYCCNTVTEIHSEQKPHNFLFFKMSHVLLIWCTSNNELKMKSFSHTSFTLFSELWWACYNPLWHLPRRFSLKKCFE